MIGDMYTDLERSIVIRLEEVLAAMGQSNINVHMQLFVVPEIGGADNPTIINISKLNDMFAPENGGGTGAKLVVKDKTKGTAQVTPWPEGYKVYYDFIVYSDDLEGMRAAEFAIKEAFKPRHPVYLYDTQVDPPVKTSSYVDITWSLYVNRDDSVERRYQRHQQLAFEVYNYTNAVAETVALITEVQYEVDTPSVSEQL